MIENYNNLIDKHLNEQAGKILNIFDKEEQLSEDIVIEIFKLAASWAIESSWLRFPDQKPRDSYPCACKPLFSDGSIPNVFIGEFDVEQDAWFILVDDSITIGGRKSGRITSPLIWQPITLGKEKAWAKVPDKPTVESHYSEDIAVPKTGKYKIAIDPAFVEKMKRREETSEDAIMAKAEELTTDQLLAEALKNKDFYDGIASMKQTGEYQRTSLMKEIERKLRTIRKK